MNKAARTLRLLLFPLFLSATLPAAEVLYSRTAGQDDTILTLRDGSRIEIVTQHLGNLGIHKRALVYPHNGTLWIWIENARSYPCVIRKRPEVGTRARRIEITGADGQTLTDRNGDTHRVHPDDAFISRFWPAPFKVLLFRTGPSEHSVINLEKGQVVRIRQE